MKTRSMLTLEDCRKISAAAEAEARNNNWSVCIAIFDDGGHLPALVEDATFRQGSPPAFGGESTVHEMTDDTSLLVSSEAKLSYADVVRPTVAQLMIMNTESEGRVIALTEPEYLIGRHRDNSIQLADLGVSGFHARLYLGPEGYVLEDLKSRNGTWVNGSRIFHATLNDGDRVHLGQTDLVYEVLFHPA